MHQDVVARLELRADLQRALVNNEFELFYQPVMRLKDGSVCGVRGARPAGGIPNRDWSRPSSSSRSPRRPG